MISVHLNVTRKSVAQQVKFGSLNELNRLVVICSRPDSLIIQNVFFYLVIVQRKLE